MKKLVSFLLTVCLCISACAMLTACTADDGAKVQVNESDWKKAFEKLDNVEIKVTQDLYALTGDEWVLGQENYRVEDYVITADGYMRSSEWNDTVYVTRDGTNYEYSIYHKNSEPTWKRKTVTEIPPITSSGPIVVLLQSKEKFGEFSYDEETKTYTASNVKYFDEHEEAELTFETVTAAFEDGKIKSFSYVAITSMNNGGTEYKYKQVIKFSFDKYGSSKLEIPSAYTEE